MGYRGIRSLWSKQLCRISHWIETGSLNFDCEELVHTNHITITFWEELILRHNLKVLDSKAACQHWFAISDSSEATVWKATAARRY